MSHRRPPLVRALQLNTAVLVVEIAAGIGSNSFSLIMDGVHNLSDEVALVLLVLAYSLRAGLSGKLLRYANLFNSIGLLAICAFLVWRVVERLVIAGRSVRHRADRCRLDRRTRQLGRR